MPYSWKSPALRVIAFLIITAMTRTNHAHEQADRDAVVARFEKLQNISAEFSERIERQGSPAIPPLEKTASFSFLRGSVRYEERLTEASAAQRERARLQTTLRYWLLTYTSDSKQDLREYLDFDFSDPNSRTSWKWSAAAVWSSSAGFDDEGILDVALGLRTVKPTGPRDGPKWFTPERLKQMRYRSLDEDFFQLEEDREWTAKCVDQWVFSRRRNYALMRCTALDKKRKHPWDVIEAEDFRNISGLTLPFKITQTSYAINSRREWQPPTISVLTLKKYEVDDASNTPTRYEIAWPHKDLKVNLYVRRDGKTLEGSVLIDRENQLLDQATVEKALVANNPTPRQR